MAQPLTESGDGNMQKSSRSVFETAALILVGSPQEWETLTVTRVVLGKKMSIMHIRRMKLFSLNIHCVFR